MSPSCKSKCHGGPGYASPQGAIKGPREEVLFVTAPHAADGPDAIVTVDVNPDSDKYCQVISRVDVPNIGDVVHHTGWNACSLCHDKPTEKRSHLIVLCLNSDRIYVINVEDERNIYLQHTIEPSKLHALNLSFPHTSHCLADGNIMITHVSEGLYGNSVHIFEWDSKKHIQTIDLPMPHGALPLEVRFLHEPTSENAFVGCALGSAIYRIHPDKRNPSTQVATMVSAIPSKKVSGWCLPEMPALITDILISMDDRFLYVSCWLHGDIRQYDISDPVNPKLNSQVYIGGSIHSESEVKVLDEDTVIPALYVKGRKIEGGPQMLQLSLDGKRLYVTTSLYKKWDDQFYPSHTKTGATMLQVNIDPTTGKMELNTEFLVDFGKVSGGPYLAHEMRYPGGDCTSDI
ncbi:unnamed protein product [Caenorhabditis brenneri]